ncbi:MAG: galactose-1-phosphate uridylyltransferase [Elusimicrobia bacterium]|nr:galactose-1-phosphate uridylyltransferase [Elusimicrobiota bacterium]
MPELRKDPIIGRWVIIATERGTRPHDFKRSPESLGGDPQNCPFCPGNESKTPPEILAYHEPGRLKDQPGWWIRVVPNKYPALQVEGAIHREGEGMYDKMSGLGAHEVIIETSSHTEFIAQMKPSRIEDVFWACRDRMIDLKKDPRMQYILIFKNHGAAAGASLAHPHSQLIATPMVPIRVKQEMAGAKAYYDYKERCVFCDILREESEDRRRVVAENEGFVAFEPYASRFPFETWIIPKIHSAHFEDVQKHQVVDLAQIMKKSLGQIHQVLQNPPLNYIVHTAPLKEMDLPHYHWHIEIMPKLTHVAGFEWGTGFYINPTPPELAAQFLTDMKGD